MKKHLLSIAALAGICGLASAQTDQGPTWSFSGFGTVGALTTDTDQAQYVIYGQPSGAKKDVNFNPDTKLGVQLDTRFNPLFSATLQLLSKYNGEGTWRPAVEWGFAKAQVTPGVALRVGRMGAPLFMVSDFRDVNYANTWLRPPQDVYGQVPFSHFDGADALGQTQWGSVTLSAQVYGGKVDSNFAGSPVHASNVIGANATAEFDNGLSLRVGSVNSKMSVRNAQVDAFLAVLRTTPFTSVADQLDATDKVARFSGVGIAYDHDDWVASAEYTQRKNHSFVSSTEGWAVTGGYRVGKFTPYVVVSGLRRTDKNVDNTIPVSNQQLAILHGTVDAILQTQNISQKTLSLGSRWDFARNLAAKFEFEQIKTGSGAIGLFKLAQPGFAGSTVNVYSVSLDFVF
jgi:hypothetical protein